MSDTAKILNEKHAIVTGGGSGIGLAIVRELATRGANVTLMGRTIERLEDACRDLVKEFDCKFTPVQVDVTKAESVAAGFKKAIVASGVPDILVCNAGGVDSKPFVKLTESDWNAVLEVNLTGVFRCIREVLPVMLEAKAGRIVNVASTAGVTGFPYVSHYCAAKHGVVGLTRALALEIGASGVTVNSVCPGYTDTELLRGSLRKLAEKGDQTEEELIAQLISKTPIGRLIRPEEVASSVAWLCEPLQSAVHGESLMISGGEVF